MFLVTNGESGISISNPSDNDKFILLKLPQEATLSVDNVKLIQLCISLGFSALRTTTIDIIQEDESAVIDGSDWEF